MRKILLAVGVLIIGLIFSAFALTLKTPGHLYSQTGEFSGCPARPSCVSSRAPDADQSIQALSYVGKFAEIPERLEMVLANMDGVLTIRHKGPYVHALFATPTLRFRDDLELLVQPDGRIEVRSVSRFGYRDFGVNRNRVEALRARWTQGAGAVR